jgi:hypothetical protein
MKRITILLAVMVAAVVLASAVALAATNVQSSPKQAKFRVTLNGFAVNQETWDHALEVDGKRDEVYIRYDTRLINNEATSLLASNDRTKIMGDTNGFSDRVLAGSASSLGGLRTGDAFPTSTPWQRSGDIMFDRPPIKLYEGPLTEGKTGVAITPTIWEWDGGTDMFNSWGQLIVDNGPEIAQAVANFINGPSLPSNPTNDDFIQTNLETGLPALFTLASGITGQAKDRPIGFTPVQGGYNFDSKSLVLTYETATLATQHDFGKGPGVLAISFQDSADIGSGQYTAYVQIERTDTPPTIPSSSLRPTAGSQITDRTPAIGATVRDAETELAKSNISLFVDGQRKTAFTYNQDTDKLRYIPSSNLSLGQHTVKVTAQDASSLTTTKSWGVKVVRF